MKKSFFAPFTTWRNFLKQPTTVRYPGEDIDVFDREGASPRYRGMHSNDLDACIGCGTCGEICPTSAISMVPGDNIGEGQKGEIPLIDYGRCCFCGFCVDVCTSSSLSMSRDYIYTKEAPLEKMGMAEIKDVYDAFRIQPDDEHGLNPGHVTPDEDSWLDLVRIEMEELSPEERISSFIEQVKGFSREQAKKEASRCVECEVCVETCPAGMEIPRYIRAVWEDDLRKAVDIMYNTNPLPGICGRICTHKCEDRLLHQSPWQSGGHQVAQALRGGHASRGGIPGANAEGGAEEAGKRSPLSGPGLRAFRLPTIFPFPGMLLPCSKNFRRRAA